MWDLRDSRKMRKSQEWEIQNMGFGVGQTWARIPALPKALASSFLGPGSFFSLSLSFFMCEMGVWTPWRDVLQIRCDLCKVTMWWLVHNRYSRNVIPLLLVTLLSPGRVALDGRWNIRAETGTFCPPQKRSTNNHYSSTHFFISWLIGEGHVSGGRDWLSGWARGATLWSSSWVHVHHAVPIGTYSCWARQESSRTVTRFVEENLVIKRIIMNQFISPIRSVTLQAPEVKSTIISKGHLAADPIQC